MISAHSCRVAYSWPGCGSGGGPAGFSPTGLLVSTRASLSSSREGRHGGGWGWVCSFMDACVYLFIHLNFLFYFILHTSSMLGAGDMETIRLGSCPPELTALQAG